MMNCKEITRKVASDELLDASFFSRLGLRLHVLFCQGCRRYTQQLKRIRQHAHKQSMPGPSREDLESLKSKILSGLRAEEKE